MLIQVAIMINSHSSVSSFSHLWHGREEECQAAILALWCLGFGLMFPPLLAEVETEPLGIHWGAAH